MGVKVDDGAPEPTVYANVNGEYSNYIVKVVTRKVGAISSREYLAGSVLGTTVMLLAIIAPAPLFLVHEWAGIGWLLLMVGVGAFRVNQFVEEWAWTLASEKRRYDEMVKAKDAIVARLREEEERTKEQLDLSGAGLDGTP